MTPARFQTIEEIFLAAVEQEPEQVSAFLDTACDGDESLRREVEALLASDQRAGRFIERSTVGLVTKIIQNRQADSLVGQTIGHYKISESIGTGGMGEVYLATDIIAGRKAALKLLPLRFTGDAERLQRFKQEARAVVALNHPNILTVYEIGEDHSVHYIASELIEGETLRQRLTHGPMQLSEAVDVAIQVASALAAAHQTETVHRDIKPENIMLRPDGYVKVLDFGIAKLAEQDVPVTTPRDEALFLIETHWGSVLGTVRYMSPEQACGAHINKTTDIWSLGVVLYEMVTGHAPFAGDIAKEVMCSILEKEPPPLTRYVARAPAELQQIVTKTLRKDRAQRYQRAHELLEALRDLRRKLEVESELQRSTAAPSWLSWVQSPITLVLVLLVAVFTLALPFYWHRKLAPTLPLEKSIAVLPFENLSDEKANAYFAEGIQNEILTRLASVRDLKVISRTSTAKYQSKPDNLKTVAQELRVSTVIEGAVQKAGDKVRVNVQLVDVRSGMHLWAKSYDRDFKDLLGVESEVSQEVADALQANLSPSESRVLASVRTPDAEAYDLFLRGEYELHQSESSLAANAVNRADAFYRQALVRDPNFAEAAAELARSRLWRHWFVSPLMPAELQEVKSLIDRALALAPNSPEAHFALGLFFYYGHHKYEAALAEFNRTLEFQPNNAWARQYCAAVYRRRGEWERSLADFQSAEQLDPRDARISTATGFTYLALRLWKDAERADLRALAIDPHFTLAAKQLLITRLNATGDVGLARRVLDDFPEITKTSFSHTSGGHVLDIIGVQGYLYVTEKRFIDAFQKFEKKVDDGDFAHLQQLAGRVALRVLAGQTEAAQSAGEEARPLLEARLRERPDDTFAMTDLSWVYLALGRNADALRVSSQTADLIPIEKDAVDGPAFQVGLAQIEARAGAPEEAVKRLRRLLSIPAGNDVSIALLKIDPVWDPIRDRPDFQQLLSGPQLIGPNK